MKRMLVVLVSTLALFGAGCSSEENLNVTDTAAGDMSIATDTSVTMSTTDTSATGYTATDTSGTSFGTDTSATDTTGTGPTGTSTSGTSSTTNP